MISNPYFISKNGNECPINMGVRVSAFGGDLKNALKVSYEGVVSVKWLKNSVPYEYSHERMHAYPTPDMEKMVVLLFGEAAELPKNALILNDQAQIVFKPEMPQRLSKKDKWLPKGELDYFEGCGWSKYDDYLYFDFPINETDWRETRFFNYKTMEWDNERYETWRL